jgi:uncharacterized membrane protein YeiH
VLVEEKDQRKAMDILGWIVIGLLAAVTGELIFRDPTPEG